MTETSLQVVQSQQIVNIEDQAMSIESLTGQVQLIQNVMKNVMKDNEHYGTIPGTNKPTLLKPGAEKLCLAFRFNPDYTIIREVREKDFIAYTIKCTLTHIPTGLVIANGIGSCNSHETKYRFRHIEESIGVPVPKKYWDAKKAGDGKEMKRSLIVPDIEGELRAAKINGEWMIAKSQKIENDNPWDLDNTIIKMACKRALVAATLNGTAASDIFTQDLEDMTDTMLSCAPKEDKKISPPMTEKLTDDQLKQIKGLIGAVKEFSETDQKNFFTHIRKQRQESVTINNKPMLTITKEGAAKIIADFPKLLSEYTGGKITVEQPNETEQTSPVDIFI